MYLLTYSLTCSLSFPLATAKYIRVVLQSIIQRPQYDIDSELFGPMGLGSFSGARKLHLGAIVQDVWGTQAPQWGPEVNFR